MGRKIELHAATNGCTKNVYRKNIFMSLTADVASESKVYLSELLNLLLNIQCNLNSCLVKKESLNMLTLSKNKKHENVNKQKTYMNMFETL